MLHKTKGIAIKYIKYRDTSIISHIFTEKFGMQAYIINSVRSKKPKNKIALYQPLTLLDMVVYNNPKADIQRISESKCSVPHTTLNTDIRKSCMVLFLTEVLHKTIKEQQDQALMFAFLYRSIQILDNLEKGYENFHVQFLLKLTQYLGIGGDEFINQEMSHLLPKDIMPIAEQLYQYSFDRCVPIKYAERKIILTKILEFYQIHIDHFGNVKSIEVLSEVLSQ